MEDPAQRRVDYGARSFEPDDLAGHPLAQFQRWYSEAVEAAVPEPNAVTLATAGPDGPSARTVLLKGVDGRGFVFYTNQRSRKALAIAHDPRVALLFTWHGPHRQVAVRGRAEAVPRTETEAYFASRPHGSRIGAWASEQSRPIASSAELRAREEELRRRFPDTGSPDDVPAPPHWGGYLVRAHEVEFWQGRTSRLHDRLVLLSRDGAPAALDDPAAWRLERRQP
ncbi:pyridoxamine 5'-phosphate oxidase [Paenibacillus sp. TRM 82003]|uniref:pyridoxamine 5'-phosphate oxidase n=1 Tax=Kineococcus sp. TRM81007 TaxID=2925831 RepID=UPI001F581939|nr:pyridoxamine 5'-phosphate oxidase [Kineococcus sp. TRM81007]MCI2239939.1 pyridoxamine 5'-phosphate oxidase [Kineococcus sp. TRM81007]MCI3925756.1 pyridoxamine 5'-phosphate oxidase [Paenibacillus sp. TRM 82003]